MATLEELLGLNTTGQSTSQQQQQALQYQQQMQQMQSLMTQAQQMQQGSTSTQNLSGFQNQNQQMAGTNYANQAGTTSQDMSGSNWGTTNQNSLSNMLQQAQTQGAMGQTSQQTGTTAEQMQQQQQQQTQGTQQQQYQYGLGPVDPATQQARQFAMNMMPGLAQKYNDPFSDPVLQAMRQSSMDNAQQQYRNVLKPTYDTMAQKSGMYGSTPWAQQATQGATNLSTQVMKELNDAAMRQQDTALQGMLSSGQLIASSGATPVMMSSTGQNTSNMLGSTTGSSTGQTSGSTNMQGWNTGSTNTTGQQSTNTSGGYTGGQQQSSVGRYTGGSTGGSTGSMTGQNTFGQTGVTDTSGWSNALSQALNQGTSNTQGLGISNTIGSGMSTAPIPGQNPLSNAIGNAGLIYGVGQGIANDYNNPTGVINTIGGWLSR